MTATTSSHAVPAGSPKSDSGKSRFPVTAIVVVLALVGAGITAYAMRDRIAARFESTLAEPVSATKRVEFTNAPWDGTISVPPEAQAAIGLSTSKVEKQELPTQLPILGTTQNDDTKITKIRPLFRGRIEKVHVETGQRVSRGDVLAEICSSDLARAKTDFSIQRSQWEYEKKLLDSRTELAKTNAITGNVLLEQQNRESRERNEYDVARDKLQVFGLSAEEIAHVDREQGQEKARFLIKSPADGIVIKREVVTGNAYDENDVLLTIAPGDHLWVWGNIFENDLQKVKVGQTWNIDFPFSHQTLTGKVEFISEAVDPAVHAVRIRTSIPNVEGSLKADMLVRGNLELAPGPTNVVIPRTALVVIDGHTYVFVRKGMGSNVFTRQAVQIVIERDQDVVVQTGLTEGEEVVTRGALILEQMYEEQESRGNAAKALQGETA